MLPLLGVIRIAGCSVNINPAAQSPSTTSKSPTERLSRPTPSVAWSYLVTPTGGVLINVPRRPAAAAHHLTLEPGDVATAHVQAYAIDTVTGNNCPRWGNLVVTPPNDYVSHPLSVDVPICSATISSVD